MWDTAALSDEQLSLVDEVDRVRGHYALQTKSSDAAVVPEKAEAACGGPSDGGSGSSSSSSSSSSGSNALPLAATRKKCEFLVEELDSILTILDEVTTLHDGVTSRSNRLMVNCETLLEEQASLKVTVEKLNTIIGPFNDIEGIATSLGIPFDAHGKATAAAGTTGGPAAGSGSRSGSDAPSSSSTSSPSSSSSSPSLSSRRLDPRSPEFKNILARLSKALSFIYEHKEIKDSAKYSRWLEQLQQRATSMVARSMQDLLEGAKKTCVDMATKQAAVRRQYREEIPLESQPLYQKFRGLSFRMRELCALLGRSQADGSGSGVGDQGGQDGANEIEQHRSSTGVGHEMMGIATKAVNGVREAYVVMRTELVLPALRECLQGLPDLSAGAGAGASGSPSAAATATGTGAGAGQGLCSNIRKAYGTVLRIAQLEKRLLDSLFLPGKGAGVRSKDGEDAAQRPMSAAAEAAAATSAGLINELTPDLTKFVCSSVADMLRPHIIREASVDELCRAITTLAEDVRSQMYAGGKGAGGGMAGMLPRPALKLLIANLDRTVSDCQERLSHCTERWLRVELQSFRPQPQHLEYPAILERAASASASISATVGDDEAQMQQGGTGTDTASSSLEDLSATWYPPLTLTLGLLSKLYGVLDLAVFEDVARRAIAHTVELVREGTVALSKRAPPELDQAELHATLFLIRHLLLLREQLLPFDIRLQSVEKRLDFSSTGTALRGMVAALASRSTYSFSQSNALLAAARSGLPSLLESRVDARRDLDGVLKDGCAQLKGTALQIVLAPVENYLAKASAFCGDIPIAVPEQWSMEAGAGPVTAPTQQALVGDAAAKLAKQSFVKAARLAEVTTEAEAAARGADGLLLVMDMYMENPVARAILLRPVAQECTAAYRKLEVVVRTCVEEREAQAALVARLVALETSMVQKLV